MGIALGVFCSVIQFIILRRIVLKIAAGSASPVLALLCALQFLLPAAVLLAVALIDSGQILAAGTADASVLILLSAGFFIKRKFFEKGNKDGYKNN